MAIEIIIPRLGWSMDQGVFSGWLKNDGELVRAGEPLFTLEGEKSTQDVEAIDDGTLSIPPDAPMAGDTVFVGAIIGYLVRNGEAGPSIIGSRHQPNIEPTVPGDNRLKPRRSRRDDPPSSPLARRLAREHGIDYTQLRGTGSSGRIRRADVLEAVRVTKTGSPRTNRSIPVSPTRRTIAVRMVESRGRTAPVTLTTTGDVANLVALRQQFKAAVQPGLHVPSFLDFTVKLTALALREHPLLNARWPDGADHIEVPESAHIGIAVDTVAGLLVPVIHDAATLGIQQIAALSADLVRRSREGRIRAPDLQGGTFTITNLGAFGVETFTPIINLPECAVLGMGKIEGRAVMKGDKVVGRARMHLSLTFDHRIVDGAPAARFLQRLVQLLENPAPWLMP